MTKLSLYKQQRGKDYRFFDRSISELFTVGAVDMYIHKYLGPSNQGKSTDYTQPQYDILSPTNIQDLLFLENRDRKYDDSIYRLRGHYNVANLDFDLSQFGLFLNNDVIFINFHYNDMIDVMGRKLMVGDVLELPHLTDYHPLNETIPIGLRRYYQITDANYSAEGFSPTWAYHLWRVKAEPLVDSQEFADILNKPIDQDNFLGDWTKDRVYPPGYVVSFGGKNYIATMEVPVGIAPPAEPYWKLDPQQSIQDILSTYKTNLKINEAIVNQANEDVPLSGYDVTPFYVVPTQIDGHPGLPDNIIIPTLPTEPIPNRGSVVMVASSEFTTASMAMRIRSEVLEQLKTRFGSDQALFDYFKSINLQFAETEPEVSSTGSGALRGDNLLVATVVAATNPLCNTSNEIITVDSTVTPKASCDPRFRFIKRESPRGFGYLNGYLTGDGQAPNGLPVYAGTSFPDNPKAGDYCLRLDFKPQLLFRFDGSRWVQISKNVRTGLNMDSADQSQISGFINNNETITTDYGVEPVLQPLSKALTTKPYGPQAPNLGLQID